VLGGPFEEFFAVETIPSTHFACGNAALVNPVVEFFLGNAEHLGCIAGTQIHVLGGTSEPVAARARLPVWEPLLGGMSSIVAAGRAY
jgi:hypothetical protein